MTGGGVGCSVRREETVLASPTGKRVRLSMEALGEALLLHPVDALRLADALHDADLYSDPASGEGWEVEFADDGVLLRMCGWEAVLDPGLADDLKERLREAVYEAMEASP